MNVISKGPRILLMAALLGGTASVAVSAQAQGEDGLAVQVTDDRAHMPEGPDVEGIISARSGDRMQVTATDGTKSVITIDDATKISASKGLFGIGKDKLVASQLMNGIPVKVKTLQPGGGDLLASRITMTSKDVKTAAMIHNGTDQRFASNEAATEGLKARMGDIDKYNIKGTTNVNFDTGKSALSPEAKQSLCQAATQADSQENALLLVVGYTDSTGPEEVNQVLSEKRASAVVNYLQQACHWKPYRMLTPTGMSMADPVADNTTEEGKAQNRRVAVNIMVSKAVDGI